MSLEDLESFSLAEKKEKGEKKKLSESVKRRDVL